MTKGLNYPVFVSNNLKNVSLKVHTRKLTIAVLTGPALLSTKLLVYWLSLWSALDTQTKHLGWRSPPKKVIAMVANVAAFGLRGSSQT